MNRPEFEHIAAELRRKALKVGLHFFSSREEAEDAAQETMERLWLYCEQIDVGRNVEALAVRVAKNCCVSMFRKRQQKVGPLDTQAIYQTDDAHSPQEQMEAADTKCVLDEVVSLLQPRERELFEMRAILGLSTEEITRQTGIPKASVIAMVSAARRKVFIELKRRMEQ